MVRLSTPLLSLVIVVFASSGDTPVHAASPERTVADETTRALALVDTYLGMVAGDPLEAYAMRRLLETAPDAGGLGVIIARAKARAEAGGATFGDQLAYGQLLAASGNHVAALAAFDAAEKMRAGRYETAWLRARSLTASGDTAAAFAAFDKAIAGARGVELMRRQALFEAAIDLAVEVRDVARAKEFARGLSATAPGDLGLKQREAAMLARLEAFSEAVEAWREIEKRAGGQLGELAVIWRELAELLERTGQTAEAEATLRRALDRLPRAHHERPVFWHALMALKRGSGELDAFAAEIDERHRRDDDALMVLAAIHEEAGRDDAALAAWREAVQRMPRREDVRVSMLRLLERVGKPDDVIAAWADLVKLSPREPRHRLKLADVLLLHEKHAEAFALLRSLAKDFATDPGVLQQVLDRWLRRRNKDDRKDIEAIYKQLLKNEPREGDHVLSYGSWLWSLGDRDAAMAMWRRLIALKPEGGRGAFEVAQAMFDHDMLDDAEKALAEVLKAGPNNVEYLRLKASIDQKRRRVQDAVATWLEIVRLAPPDAVSGQEARERVLDLWEESRVLEARVKDLDRQVRGRLQGTGTVAAATVAEGRLVLEGWVRLQQLDGARALLDLLAGQGGAGRAVLVVGEQVAVRQGDFAAARDYAVKLATDEPRLAHEHYRRAASHARQLGDNDAAIRFVRAGVEANPGSPAPHRVAGELFVQLGKAREALEAFERAAGLDPADMEMRFRVAGLHRTAGQSAREVAVLSAVVRDARDGRDVQRAGRRLLALGPAGLAGPALDAFEAMVRQKVEGGQQSSAHARILLELQLSRALQLVAGAGVDAVEARAGVREALARLGERALKATTDGLFSTDQGMRDTALRLVELTLPAGAVPALGRLATDPEPAVAARALAALGGIGSEGAVRVLARIHADKQHRGREVALWAAGLTATPHALPLFEAALQSPSPRDRLISALALGLHPSVGGAALIVKALNEPGADVREAGLRAARRWFEAAESAPDLNLATAARDLIAGACVRAVLEGRNARADALPALLALVSGPLPGATRTTLKSQLLATLWAGNLDDEVVLAMLESLESPASKVAKGAGDLYAANYRAMFRVATGNLAGVVPIRTHTSAVPVPADVTRFARLVARPDMATDMLVAFRSIFGLETDSSRTGARVQRSRDRELRAIAMVSAGISGWPPAFRDAFQGLGSTGAATLAAVAREHPATDTRIGAVDLAMQLAVGRDAALSLVRQIVAAGPSTEALGLIARGYPGPDDASQDTLLRTLEPSSVPVASRPGLARAVAVRFANDAAILERWLGGADAAVQLAVLHVLAVRPEAVADIAPRLVELALDRDEVVALAAVEALQRQPESLALVAASLFPTVRARAMIR